MQAATQNTPAIRNKDLLYPELSYNVTGAIFDVWKELGPAYKEVVYQKALENEFNKRGISFAAQKQIAILYNGQKVGVYTPDFIIDDKTILEIKCIPNLTFREKKQGWYYLKGTEYKLLLMVNFGGYKIEIIRRVYDKARKI